MSRPRFWQLGARYFVWLAGSVEGDTGRGLSRLRHVLRLAFSSNPPAFRHRERVSDEDMPERGVERLICQVSDGEGSRFHSQLGANGCGIQQTETARRIFFMVLYFLT